MIETLVKDNRIFPYIRLELENGLLEIKGNSIPEDASIIYQPIVDKLKRYVQNPEKQTLVNFHLSYFNTSTSKWILYILKVLRTLYNRNKKIIINWYYDADDKEILEAGRDYQSIVRMPINMLRT